MRRAHPVQKIIDHHLKRGKPPPEFRQIQGRPDVPGGISWWVKTGELWSHVIFQGKRQFVDGREL